MDALARDLMTRPVRRLAASASLPDAAAFLLRWGISGAPVEDETGRWVGVFSLSDLARHVQRRLAPVDPAAERTLESRDDAAPALDAGGLATARVADLMTGGLYSVFPEATTGEVIRLLARQRIHRVFVLSERGAIEGVITTLDVLRWLDRG